MINIKNTTNNTNEPLKQQETHEHPSSLTYKTCVLVLKVLFLVPILKFIFSIKIIPAGSLASFSGSAYCGVYGKL